MPERTCPVLTNWTINKWGECDRYMFCDDSRHKICGASPKSDSKRAPRPYSRRGKGICPHRYTRTVPTKDTVIIDGERKKVFEVICKECGNSRRLIL